MTPTRTLTQRFLQLIDALLPLQRIDSDQDFIRARLFAGVSIFLIAVNFAVQLHLIFGSGLRERWPGDSVK